MPLIIPAKGANGAVAGALLGIAGPGGVNDVQVVSRPQWGFQVSDTIYVTAMETIPGRFITGVPDPEPEPEPEPTARFETVDTVVAEPEPEQTPPPRRRGRPKKLVKETVS